MRAFNNLENKTSSGTCRKVQLVCMKLQAHSSLGLTLEQNQDQKPFRKEGLLGLS